MSKQLVLNPFTLDADEHSAKSAIYFLMLDEDTGELVPEPSLTVQSDLESSDINFIVRQYIKTGLVPYGLQIPEYADYTDAPTDFQAAMNFVKAADDVFMEMPADIRSRFNHNPGEFMQFFNDPANQDEAIKLGLAVNIRPSVVDEVDTEVKQA